LISPPNLLVYPTTLKILSINVVDGLADGEVMKDYNLKGFSWLKKFLISHKSIK